MVRRSLLRLATIAGSIGLYLLIGFLILALVSYKVSDPALNTVAGPQVYNLMGPPGAWAADLMLTFGGALSVLLLPVAVIVPRRIRRP